MPDRWERKYQSLPIEDKESNKWITAAKKSKSMLKEASMLTFIEDREGDIYERLSSIGEENIHYVIRSRVNRNAKKGNLHTMGNFKPKWEVKWVVLGKQMSNLVKQKGMSGAAIGKFKKKSLPIK